MPPYAVAHKADILCKDITYNNTCQLPKWVIFHDSHNRVHNFRHIRLISCIESTYLHRIFFIFTKNFFYSKKKMISLQLEN
jgi:hypothetical protein